MFHPGGYEHTVQRNGFPTFEEIDPAMTDFTPPALVVLTTVSSPRDASRIGRTLVEERLAACATILPGVESIYHWQGAVETATETMLLLKTVPDQLEALQTRLLELHTYDVPEFLVLRVESGSAGYLDWLRTTLRRV